MNEQQEAAPEAVVEDAVERSWIKKLGPGLTTGAADDDPSGIATYSQAGAQFGYNLLWTLLLTYPLMVAVQTISARVGRVTGNGLASNMRRFGPVWLLGLLVLMLAIANTINIAADLAAMGAAVHLLAGGPQELYIVAVGLCSLLLQVFISYEQYARILKWSSLALFSYVAVAFLVPLDWHAAAFALIHPEIQPNASYLTTVVAVLGTTISPYLFFWQASQEVEEMRSHDGQGPLLRLPGQARLQFGRINQDTWTGMALSNGIALFIMLTAAATLHVHHIEIKTSADAAQALRPIAGRFASLVFAVGIIGTGLLALPVLAGSAAYAAAGAFRWRSSLSLHLGLAREFYAVIAIALCGGIAITFFKLDPIKALYWSAVINGLAAVPVMIVLMLMAASRKIMGEFAIQGWLRIGGWLATGLMALAAIAMFVPTK